MFASKDIFLKSSGGYQISRSVRLRSSASAYFTRTPSVAGNRRTFTISAWVKKGRVDDTAAGVQASSLFGAGNTGNVAGFKFAMGDVVQGTNTQIFSSQETIHNVSNQFVWYGTERYRDSSAWYHVVVAFDTPQATASNRLKIWVNGQQIGAGNYTVALAQNQDLSWNNTVPQFIGASTTNSAPWLTYFDGLLAEVYSVDGQALTPSSFGETNAVTGVWQPKKYTGTYGTNGFYLNFSDNSGVTATTIGKDYSGNGNNWTPSAGISITAGATYDSMLDVPTLYADGGNGRGNYCVLNPLDWVLATNTITDGNLNITTSASNISAALGTIAVSSGKWYFEFTPTSVTGIPQIGIVKTPVGTISTNGIGQSANAYVYLSNGNKGNNNSFTAYGATYTNADVIGVALDLDAGTLVFYKNNASQGTAFTSLSGEFFPVIGDTGAASTIAGNINFGQRPFTYTPPTGFKALNTQNLPTPTISNGATVMAATLWTGNGTSQSISNAVNGISFQPDMVWVKDRSAARSHVLIDAVRGTGLTLFPNETTADQSNTDRITSFNSNGFSVGAGLGTNANTETYVGWQWNAGGTSTNITVGQYGTSPNVPSIASTVRANATAGFSVVTWTGAGSAGTIGHGLGVTPSMIIIKNRSGIQFWFVNHTSISATQNLYLNDTSSVQSDVVFTSRGSTTFGVGANVAASSTNYVAYCFAAVAGYSAFGSYTGNGSTDGPFVFLGFRPRFVLFKRTDAANDWVIHDSSRNTFNVVDDFLKPNLSNAEGAYSTSGHGVDFLSSGMKLRTDSGQLNASTGTYIYAAFAENPFKLSLAR